MRITHFVDAIFAAPGAVPPMHMTDHIQSLDAARHPFWEFDSAALQGSEVIFCTIALTFAGILCSAGGIGGGGVYVTVLMVAGALSPHDAVPLSKAIVFFGSLSSLVLNLRKQMANDSTRKALIDYNICRLVVPASLIGTLLGVLLNRYTSGSVIVCVLSFILVVMTWTSTRTAYFQYLQEEEEERTKRQWQPRASQEGSEEASQGGSAGSVSQQRSSASASGNNGAGGQGVEGESAHELQVQAFAPAAAKKLSSKHVATGTDAAIGLLLLVTVVSSGVLRFHADACEKSVQHHHGHMWSRSGPAWQACHHPVVAFFGLGDGLERSMSGPDAGSRLFFAVLFVPFVSCLGCMAHYGKAMVAHEAWPPHEVLKYQAVAACTGCLAGLVGIGGGLIFSPFFLIMGVEPAIAVATSSTCVIFTSSSTTFQYLFTDRIIMSLTLVYGLVNLGASYAGTSLVHILQDRFSARRSCITGIVAAGVFVSAVLSLAKLVSNEEAVRH